MSVEARWYTDAACLGQRPHCRRLSRQPAREQFEAAIHLAIAWASGRAGSRPVYMYRTREEYWHWPDGDALPWSGPTPDHATGWWLIPQRTVERARLLWRSAMRCAATAGRGSAGDTDVLAVLNRWRESGHWRRIAARVWPRHPGPRKPRGRPRKRRGGRPARAPRGLP